MAPKRVFRRHLPLITPRIGFTVQVLPPPTPITLRINLAERINHHRRRQLDGAPTLVVTEKPARPAVNRGTTPQAPALRDKGQIPGVGISQGSESELSDLESIDELDDHPKQAAEPGATLIPKPPGEPGRPHSGGFNLEDAVASSGWQKQDFAAFRKRAHELISQSLDESRGFSKQPQYKLSCIYNKLKKEFPRLRRYEELWPATSIIKVKLKSASEAARRQAKATSPASQGTPNKE